MTLKEEYNNLFNINIDELEFLTEVLNKNDRILLVGFNDRYKEDLNVQLSKYDIAIAKNSEEFLNKFYKSGKSFKEISFLSEGIKELKDIRIIRELSEKVYDQLGVNGYIVLRIINYDKFIIKNKEENIFDDNEIITPIWKEDLINVLKNIGFVDIEVFGSFDKDNFNEINSSSMIIRGRKYVDLLKDSPEYEEYSENVVEPTGCGGCCSKRSGGCSGCSGCSSGCSKH